MTRPGSTGGQELARVEKRGSIADSFTSRKTSSGRNRIDPECGYELLVPLHSEWLLETVAHGLGCLVAASGYWVEVSRGSCPPLKERVSRSPSPKSDEWATIRRLTSM
jgi:hypothetical protein